MRIATTLLAAAGLATGQEATDDAMAGMDHAAMGHDGAMGEMMGAMPSGSVGTVDADVLVMMIPRGQAAIGMARAELAQGRDEATRAMAQGIIDAQGAEIAEMTAMLEAMGVEVPAAE